MRDRLLRVNDEIMRELNELLRFGIKDPRVGSFVSCIKVDTSQDYKYCKAHISVMGDTLAKERAMEGIRSAAGFIRREVALRLNMRVTPAFTFELDDSVEEGFRLDGIIRDVNKTK